jgi:hypothetical protein
MLQDEIAPHVELVGSAQLFSSCVNSLPVLIEWNQHLLNRIQHRTRTMTSDSWHKDSGLADLFIHCHLLQIVEIL